MRRIFCSRADSDRSACATLETFFKPIRDRRNQCLWHVEHIKPGEDRQAAIDRSFSEAAAIVILVSSDYLATADCMAQLERAQKRQRDDGIPIIPILVRPASWKETSLKTLRPLPEDEVPIGELEARWQEVAECLGERLRTPEEREEQARKHAEAVAAVIEANPSLRSWPANPIGPGRFRL